MPLFQTLVDDRDVEGEFGLNANLESILYSNQEDIPSCGLCVWLPFISMSTLHRFEESQAEICLAFEPPRLCPCLLHEISESVQPPS
jgi:hypothetical protein